MAGKYERGSGQSGSKEGEESSELLRNCQLL
jgi:hypothetical protein